MKVEALNCPNCGATVADNSNHCNHCRSRLKTMSCSSCFGTIFQGNKFCPLCGEKAVRSNIADAENTGDCPRCKVKLKLIEINDIALRECEKCEGIWSDVETFEIVCADKEQQSTVLSKLDEILRNPKTEKISYVPCPDCKKPMNRNNFAKVSGIIIDSCKEHGIWFDAEELPKIIEFISKGRMELSRHKEKTSLEAERQQWRAEKFKMSIDRFRNEDKSQNRSSHLRIGIRDFIDFIFD